MHQSQAFLGYVLKAISNGAANSKPAYFAAARVCSWPSVVALEANANVFAIFVAKRLVAFRTLHAN